MHGSGKNSVRKFHHILTIAKTSKNNWQSLLNKKPVEICFVFNKEKDTSVWEASIITTIQSNM
jgi:hypothetical protein